MCGSRATVRPTECRIYAQAYSSSFLILPGNTQATKLSKLLPPGRGVNAGEVDEEEAEDGEDTEEGQDGGKMDTDGDAPAPKLRKAVSSNAAGGSTTAVAAAAAGSTAADIALANMTMAWYTTGYHTGDVGGGSTFFFFSIGSSHAHFPNTGYYQALRDTNQA